MAGTSMGYRSNLRLLLAALTLMEAARVAAPFDAAGAGAASRHGLAHVTTRSPSQLRYLWTSPSLAVDPYAYLPSLPGHRPDCAGPDETFCSEIKGYPRDLIRYLLERSTLQRMLVNETGDVLVLEETPYIPPANASADSKNRLADRRTDSNKQHYPSAGGPLMYPTHDATTNATVGLRYPYHFNNKKPHPSRYPAGFNHKPNYEHGHHRYRRQAGDGGDLCPTTGSFVQPRAAMNAQGNWKYVVNLREVNPRYTQLVRAETCVSGECRGVCEVPLGFRATCRQQYVQKRLVSLEGEGVLSTDLFWFPHCCTCQVRQG